MISTFRFILASLFHYRRSSAATALGVIVATTVLTGAFLVGHSMRASLRELALDSIGSIDHAILASRFIPNPNDVLYEKSFSGRAEFDVFEKSPKPVELRSAAKRGAKKTDAVTVAGTILLEGTLENDSHRVRSVKIYGVAPQFWNFFESSDKALPKNFTGREVILNRSTAKALGVKSGESILIRLPRFEEVPTESIFGHKDESTESLRLKVSRIIPDQGPGRFTLNPSQHAPMLAYVPLTTLQQRLNVPDGKVNAILCSGEAPKFEKLSDLGIYVDQINDAEEATTVLSTDRMLFLPGNEDYLTEKILALSTRDDRKVKPVLTYLANSIYASDHDANDKKIPYSTITAYDHDLPTDFLESRRFNRSGDDSIILNAWTAQRLGVKPGDKVTIRYFRPDSPDYEEASDEFWVAAILPMSGQTIDPHWTPRVPGVTDELTMANWDPPFPFDIKQIQDEDEAYWDKYKATPKAFVFYGTGKRLWGSQIGQATSLRITPPLTKEELHTLAKEIDPVRFGLIVQNVRARALEASVGTTSFEGLFIGLSLFVIAAALILVALMFRLGVEARAQQIGLLAAVGFSRRRITKILIGQGLSISILGSLIGVFLGILYARLLIFGLSTWWIGAIGTPFLSLHIAPSTLLFGFIAGTLTSTIVIILSIRRLMKIDPNRLLAGQTEQATAYHRHPLRRRIAWAITLTLWAAVGAIFTVYFTIGIDARYETLTFFGSGVLTLLATLATARLILLLNDRRPMLIAGTGAGNRLRFAVRSAARYPMRSMAIIGMMAATVFLIVSIGAFQIEPIKNASDPTGPTGGFQLVGQSDLPIHGNFQWDIDWTKFGFNEEKQKLLDQCHFIPMRVNSGDNASCLNLFRPGAPQILSIPPLGNYILKTKLSSGSLLEKLFSISHDQKLYQPLSGNFKESKETDPENQPVDVAMEKNVANYSFQLWGGIGEAFQVATASDKPIDLKVKELLGSSPFLGNLLIAESDFQRLFPDVEGYRFFLIRTPEGKEEAVRAVLERGFGDYGFAAEQTVDRMASIAIVQNTYLATFQSLGGLGLLLGLFGLLALEVRNVMERRSELALLSAIGFQRRTLVTLLSLENSLLLVLGLIAGLIASLVAILPHLLDTTATAPVGLLTSILGLILLITLLGFPLTAHLALRPITARDIQRDR